MTRLFVTWVSLALVVSLVGCAGTPTPPPETTPSPSPTTEPSAAATAPPEVPATPSAPAPYALVEPAEGSLEVPRTRAETPEWENADERLVARSRSLRPFSSVQAVQQVARALSDSGGRGFGLGAGIGTIGYGAGAGGMPSAGVSMSAGSGLGSGAASASSASRAASPSAGAPSESITSQQVTGIDEGDIVKMLGDHFIVLREGVLYSIATSGGLSVRDRALVQLPGEGQGWIDELIVHEGSRRVVVTGFVEDENETPSTLYQLFVLRADGGLERGESLYLRSSDYYSEDNYATRLLGDQLIAYSVHELNTEPPPRREDLVGLDPEEQAVLREEGRWDRELPAMRIGRSGAFRPIWSPQRLYQLPGTRTTTMHAVTSCDLATTPLRCSSRAVMASGDAELFVSHTAAYLFVWGASFDPEPDMERATDEQWERYEATSHVHPLYRLPHTGGAPQVTPVVGRPVSVLSFMESADTLHVLLDTSEVPTAEEREGSPQVALARLSLRDFGRVLPRQGDFRPLPGWSVSMVRFVGERFALYGTDSGDSPLYAHDIPANTTQVLYEDLRDGRIDPLGTTGALVAWDTAGGLDYLTLDLRGAPRVAEHRRIPSTGAAETRTHGFFFRPDAEGGTFGMPLTVQQDRARSMVAFFDVREFRTRLVGELSSQPLPPQACHNSCFDWYGNSRPIFWGERIFALLGSELVEGAREGGRVVDRGRVVMTPPEPPSTDE